MAYAEKIYSRGFLPNSKSGTGDTGLWDLEDLAEFGKLEEGCPFFTARALAPMAQIVFCPYNYLIDPSLRASMDLNTDGGVIVLDEAHNIEDVCRDAGSSEYTSVEIMSAVNLLIYMGALYDGPVSFSAQYLAKFLNQVVKALESRAERFDRERGIEERRQRRFEKDKKTIVVKYGSTTAAGAKRWLILAPTPTLNLNLIGGVLSLLAA